ncbi:MAG: hypothetical protein FWH20_05085 [Oscillospiraceae bacterium]|nr:hypothetical protein [Oscillospiraceae bacterium]
MRIGQVTQDNYKDFLRILGVKNPKNLERLNGESEKSQVTTSPLLKGGSKIGKITMDDICFDELERRLVASGACEGMLVRPGETPSDWQKIVDVPDSIRDRIVNKMREMVLSMSKGGLITASQADELNALKKEYRGTIPPSERKSATWTLGQIAGEEEVRLVSYIMSRVPGWQPGMAFDPKILTESNWGLGFDVKA